ncbi:hypothetical protein KEM48_009205 [Puccinia striiformis f. sp. tritici PST-130]|uniref:Uncharacterized protein n=1 Tax=Puccinia striiformis f. sp. tritici PST-78 TaxID=1165861 RepID=A0A0L0V9M5_9BASI|nr:hypothetical protein Pst134EB_029955 [Puccinia striiformis f. sp. tritici]KAI9623978.1 hypothetical protein KEM48_009205 [Puccinia striiformis f. sp. tritici PST-130]KNE95980.1 hypothetical protein PSTG_10671 [Puccinia striiformis f. sp. tritici PST-78]
MNPIGKIGLAISLMPCVVGHFVPAAQQPTPSSVCSGLLGLVGDAPDPCISLTFREYLEVLRIDESSCSVQSGCSLTTNENSMVGFSDNHFLEDVGSSADNLSIWQKSINEFHPSEGAHHVKKLARRALPPIVVEKSKNVWRSREDATPRSILDRALLSPVGSAQDHEEKHRSHEPLSPPFPRTFEIGSGSHTHDNHFDSFNSMSDSSSNPTFSDDEGPASTNFTPDYSMGASHGRIIRASDPIAASEKRAVFNWIPDPHALRILVGGAKTKYYQRRAPVVPSPEVDQMEAQSDAQLREPLFRLQHLVEIKLQKNRAITFDLLKEEAIEINSLLAQLVQIIETLTLTKYSRIKKYILAYHESYSEACRLLQEVTDVCMNVANNLDRLGEHVDLHNFDDTLDLMGVVRQDVVELVSQRMALEMKDLLRRMEDRVDLSMSHLGATQSPFESDPQSLPIGPQSFPTNTNPERGPSASESQESFRDETHTPSGGPRVMRSIENVADDGQSFLKTLENLKKSQDALKKDSGNFQRMEEHRYVLEKELQDVRRQLSQSGTAKIWADFWTKEKIEDQKVELDTVIQDMFASNYLIRALQIVFLGRKLSYNHNDKTYHDLAWVLSDGLKAALEKASVRQMDRLADVLESSTTATLMSVNRASLANFEALVKMLAHTQPDGMRWIQLQGHTLAEILKLRGPNFSHEEAVWHLKEQLSQVAHSAVPDASVPYAVLLNYQLEPWLSKLNFLDRKFGSESLASVHHNIHDTLRNQFEWEVEKVIGEVIMLKNSILGLAPGEVKPPAPAHQTKLLTRRNVLKLDDNKEVSQPTSHVRKIKARLLRGSSKRFQRAQSLPLTHPDGMLQLSLDFGTSNSMGSFSKHKTATDDLIGLITSIELYKAAGVCPMAAHGLSPELELAEQLWRTYESRKGAVLDLAESWRPFGLIFQDILQNMMGSISPVEPQVHEYSALWETYQQTVHRKDCYKLTSCEQTKNP